MATVKHLIERLEKLTNMKVQLKEDMKVDEFGEMKDYGYFVVMIQGDEDSEYAESWLIRVPCLIYAPMGMKKPQLFAIAKKALQKSHFGKDDFDILTYAVLSASKDPEKALSEAEKSYLELEDETLDAGEPIPDGADEVFDFGFKNWYEEHRAYIARFVKAKRANTGIILENAADTNY